MLKKALNIILFSFLTQKNTHIVFNLVNLNILLLEVGEIIFSRVHPLCIEMVVLEGFFAKHNQTLGIKLKC